MSAAWQFRVQNSSREVPERLQARRMWKWCRTGSSLEGGILLRGLLFSKNAIWSYSSGPNKFVCVTPSLHKSKLPKAELLYGETQHTIEGQLSRDRTELQGKEGERRGEKSVAYKRTALGEGDLMAETHFSEQPEDEGKLPETWGIKTRSIRAPETQLKNILYIQNLKIEHL